MNINSINSQQTYMKTNYAKPKVAFGCNITSKQVKTLEIVEEMKPLKVIIDRCNKQIRQPLNETVKARYQVELANAQYNFNYLLEKLLR